MYMFTLKKYSLDNTIRKNTVWNVAADDLEPDTGTLYKQLCCPDCHHLLYVQFQINISKMSVFFSINGVSALDKSRTKERFYHNRFQKLFLKPASTVNIALRKQLDLKSGRVKTSMLAEEYH